MIEQDKTLEIYEKLLYDTSQNITIYIEGKTRDKMFYSGLEIFNKCNIIQKGSCSFVNSSVISNKHSLGIIDRDYDYKVKSSRIFKIKYYSIENIMLIYNEHFKELRTIIKKKMGLLLFSKSKYKECQSKN